MTDVATEMRAGVRIHEVRGGALPYLVGLHGAGGLNRPAEEQELFRKRRLASIGWLMMAKVRRLLISSRRS